jgi:hypothetical protein
MKNKIFAACATAMLFSSAFALTPAEQKAEKDHISAEYKAANDQCKTLKGNAKDVCQDRAKGKKKVAEAELDYKKDPSERHRHNLAKAKADADYSIAKENCEDAKGNAKDVCKKEAKAAHVKALEAAKVAEARHDPSAKPSDVAEARKDAGEKTREADYKAVKERCEALSGDAKDTCVADAKRQFGQ